MFVGSVDSQCFTQLEQIDLFGVLVFQGITQLVGVLFHWPDERPFVLAHRIVEVIRQILGFFEDILLLLSESFIQLFLIVSKDKEEYGQEHSYNRHEQVEQ